MLWIWIGFITFVFAMLALDLGVFHRKAHVVGVREALLFSAMWIGLGLAFSVFIYFGYENHWLGLGSRIDPADHLINNGASAALKYLTGYLVEKSLSVDNVFVIAMIFAFFAVPEMYQHRVLFWGIVGALMMRGLMIAIGARLIAEFHWVLYLFGVFLIITAVKMLLIKPGPADLSQNILVRTMRRMLPVTDQLHGQHFLVRANGWMLTPLALTLVIIEVTDLVFAVDSIPAIFAITADPFLVFTSNIFAILGLRSLYFALAGMITKFRYLKTSLAAVLALIGVKMLIADTLKSLLGSNFNLYLLGLVLLILVGGVVASLLGGARRKESPCTVQSATSN